MSGFGLSLTKWTLIVKRSADLSGAFARSRMHGATNQQDGGGGLDLSASAENLFGSHSSSSSSSPTADGSNSWLWWLIMAFGLLICVRAIVQYLHIKRAWAGLSTNARERLFFFY